MSECTLQTPNPSYVPFMFFRVGSLRGTLYLALCDSTTFYHGSTWLYLTLCGSTTFYHGSTWLYVALLHSTMALLHSTMAPSLSYAQILIKLQAQENNTHHVANPCSYLNYQTTATFVKLLLILQSCYHGNDDKVEPYHSHVQMKNQKGYYQLYGKLSKATDRVYTYKHMASFWYVCGYVLLLAWYFAQTSPGKDNVLYEVRMMTQSKSCDEIMWYK